MYKVLKLGEEIFMNVEDPLQEMVGLDENGEPILGERKLLPDTKNELIQIATDTLLFLQRQRLQSILGQYGYNSLGDVNLYASQNDTEAQALTSWYSAYDTEIWRYIDSLNAKTKSQILADLQDMTSVEEQAFQNAVQTAPLP